MASTPAGHRIVETDTLSTLTGPSARLTCSCGWSGHSTRWNDLDHAGRIPGAGVPPLPPISPPPPISRDTLRAAIYGERRHR